MSQDSRDRERIEAEASAETRRADPDIATAKQLRDGIVALVRQIEPQVQALREAGAMVAQQIWIANNTPRAEVASLQAKLERAKERDEMLTRERDGEVWCWQGNDEDHPESLTCPVLIQPDALRALLAVQAKLEAAEGEIRNIDSLLARRPALADEPTRYDKIAKAIRAAHTAWEQFVALERKLEAAERACQDEHMAVLVLRGRAEAAERERDTVLKRAKAMSAEDAVQSAFDGESEVQARLRWFGMLALLQIEIARAKRARDEAQQALSKLRAYASAEESDWSDRNADRYWEARRFRYQIEAALAPSPGEPAKEPQG